MTEKLIGVRRVPWINRAAVALGVSALLVGTGLGAMPATAATNTVTDATFSWTVNVESGSRAAIPGHYNFLSAGIAGDAGASRVWKEEDNLYKAEDGNVTITKPDAEGNQVLASWDTKHLDPNGAVLGFSNPSHNQVNITGGSGTVDPEADNAEIQWEGSFSIVYYSGLTYWSLSDIKLEVTDGVGQFTGWATGYGASMSDRTQWEALEGREIVVADLPAVDVTEDGFVVKPAYEGVAVDINTETMMDQVLTGSYPGSFPQSWVDFSEFTQQSSYWYSSGGSFDHKKEAAPITVSYVAETELPNEGGPGDIDVTIPEDDGSTDPGPVTGALEWAWEGAGSSAASLGTADQDGDTFVATGSLNDVVVTDTREGGADAFNWTLSGQASAFESASDSFASTYLGWTPNVVQASSDAVTEGDPVAPGSGEANGLQTARTLATSTDAANATVDAALELVVPTTTAAGDYTSTLTISLISE
ncbi:MAG: hypothetical protein ACTHXA_01970 [Gulosibacter sp.]|uniref:hypothetical protein n=1 Tax=Gulosibacter sp. TaxID=2817531 RepID=UPI003F93DAC0